jgi:uncharacterized membrane protein YdjX (TVP38/TMEM64 family)
VFGWKSVLNALASAAESARSRAHILDDLLFFSIIVGGSICALPGMSMIEIACGFILGFWEAFFVNLISMVVGGCLAFFLGRRYFKSMINQYLESSDLKTMKLFLRSLEQRSGIVLLILFRLMLIPLFVKNYGPSVVDVQFTHYLVAVVATTPFFVAMLSYIGSRAQTMADIASRGTLDAIPWFEYVALIVSIAASLAFTWLAYREFVKLSGIKEEESRPIFPSVEGDAFVIGQAREDEVP